jgi:signal transduction histidine kinase
MPLFSPSDRTSLAAVLAHELRTPLSIMLLLAEQLERNDDDTMTEHQVECAGIIHACGRELLGVLDSMLDLARSEAGALVLDPASVSVGELGADLCREFAYLARERRLDLMIEVGPSVPTEFVTDPRRLRQVLNNLLANAIKFTDSGGVRVQFDVVATRAAGVGADGRRELAVSVIDTGIGIDPLDEQRIFDSFAQGHGTTGRRSGGAGLGLSISRQLVELLGGRIAMSSTPGEGSTFTVYLPLDDEVATSAVPEPDHDLSVHLEINGSLHPLAHDCLPT